MTPTPMAPCKSRPPKLALWLVAAAAGLALNCAAAPSSDVKGTDRIAALLHARGVEANDVVVPNAVSEDMRNWAFDATRGIRGPEAQLERLRRALVTSEKMQIRYQAGYTGTAAEVFRRQEANCLSFAHLFVGLARSIGLPVYFVVEGKIEGYHRSGSLRVANDHIAVGYGDPWRRQVIYFETSYRDDHRTFHRISDLRAIAMYYSNRGVEQLQAGRVTEALGWLETAVMIEPGLATAWVNLGVARRRRGDPRGAESAYRQSLTADPNALSAYRNLASLLREQGRAYEAATYEQKLTGRPGSDRR